MIYITGDMHGQKDRFRAVKRARCKKGDALLVCGDFGFLWEGGETEEKLLRWIGKRRYTTLFVDGCNENHALLENYPVVELFGGKARRISGRLYQLLRGEVYEIEGRTVFAMGGGEPLESLGSDGSGLGLLPSPGEIENGRRNLALHENRADIIITHDAPPRIRDFLDMEGHNEPTPLHAFLEEVGRTVRFGKWYIGKYHQDRTIPPRYHLVFTGVLKYEPPPAANQPKENVPRPSGS